MNISRLGAKNMNNIKKEDEFILDVKRLGINGEGIGYYNRLAIFVPNAIPGEGHNIKITEVKSNMAFGKSLEIKNKSEYRKEPKCIYYDKCGGCNTMHIDYNKMLDFKRDILVEALNKYSGLNTKSFEIKKTIGLNEFNYRNKSQLPLRVEDDKLKVAMIKENSNIFIPIDECIIQNKLLNDLNNSICKIIEKNKISIYSYKEKKGIIRYITIRVNKNNEALVDLVCYQYEDLKNLADEIMKLKGVKGVYQSLNTVFTQGASIVGGDLIHLAGDKYIIETLGNIKYMLYPDTFFQLNTLIAEEMMKTVLKSLKLSFKERVLDAYSGVGTIGLYIAHNSKEVIGIENNKSSVLAANENAKLNNIKNAKFLQGNAEELLPKMIKDGEEFDAIVVDPPRTGLNDKFIKALLESNVKRIVYVSCNPATLAKNLSVLKEKYNVNSITPFDMFPNTAHVESVTLLVKR